MKDGWQGLWEAAVTSVHGESESVSRAERLVDEYADLILRVSYTYLRTTADAEDICQEVLLKLLLRCEPFKSEAHERAWVVRVTINACKDLLRRQAVRSTVAIEEVPDLESPEPADEEHELRRSQRILAAVMGLPLSMREVVFLYYYEGWSLREVARACGCSEAAATKRLSRARAQLREALGSMEGISDEQL